eukprot:365325-Chlamydomonas_euryale.AAC.37
MARAGGSQLLCKFCWLRTLRTGAAAHVWVAVGGATTPAYTLSCDDAGCMIKVTATPQNPGMRG